MPPSGVLQDRIDQPAVKRSLRLAIYPGTVQGALEDRGQQCVSRRLLQGKHSGGSWAIQIPGDYWSGRDGAFASTALLQMGFITEVRDFLRWYAPHQFGDGKIPCCIDQRGADPTP